MSQLRLIKAHALGNDFLLLSEPLLPAAIDCSWLARKVCARHHGLGADGLIIYAVATDPEGGAEVRARMQLLNSDGSYSEVSGNGVRCLAAWLASGHGLRPGGRIDIDTDAGPKRLTLEAERGGRYTFRAAMGHPEAVARETLVVGEEPTDVVTLRVGNPQCVVLGEVSEDRLLRIASKLAVHPRFTEGTNVELAFVESPGRVRILIWERGAGPTEASGTGACAAAVAAIAFGGAGRDVQVAAPGGTQRVEWTEDGGLFLTGWAEVVADAVWLPPLDGGAPGAGGSSGT